MKFTREKVYSVLKGVMDPEIPVLSLVDLGVVGDVVVDDKSIFVEMRPTFVGCPAITQMKLDVESKLYGLGADNVEVEISFKSPWTSDMITEEGRKSLKEFGYAPPSRGTLIDDIDFLEHAECPRCGNSNTEMTSAFGPTLCRSIHYCNDCQEAFQSFKTLN